MFWSAKMGMVRATTRPPISRARLDGNSWCSVRSADRAEAVRTFQFSGRLA